MNAAPVIEVQKPEVSTPNFFDFNPMLIPSQAKVIRIVDFEANYSLGVLEILLSGAVGSAKSIVAAHLAVRHCLMYPRARVMLGRRALPDLRGTIFQKIIEHLEDPKNRLVERRDYWINWSSCTVVFKNKSEIISKSWADKRYKKFRSLELSAAIFEELTENDDEAKQAYDETKNRVGRLTHIPEKWIICCTNPDSPQHWAFKYFIQGQSEMRRVIYSKTRDNPFLPNWYETSLRKDMDPKIARRMLDGEWLEINTESLYYEYNSEVQYKKNIAYKVDARYPICIAFDFNIGFGKPMSSCAYQYINDTFHVFAEVIVQGARTLDAMEEWIEKGIFNHKCKIIIHGDRNGKNSDTRNLLSDYDLIMKKIEQVSIDPKTRLRQFEFQLEVPAENPALRTRHNRVNAYCKNALGEIRLWVYAGCKTVDEGMRLTALKKGGEYIEDDSKEYQHVTTALGYGIVYDTNRSNVKISSQKKG